MEKIMISKIAIVKHLDTKYYIYVILILHGNINIVP